jgi:hypothetical protein
MTIDAIITMMVLPYTILLEKKDIYLEQLYLDVSNTTDPIISFTALKQTFNPDNYQVKVYKWEEPKLLPGRELPDNIIATLKRMKDEAMRKEGKQYIELTKEDIKELFSIELYRDKQLNKILE